MVERAALITSTNARDEAAVRLVQAIEDADRQRGYARVAIPGGSAASLIGMVRARLDRAIWSRMRLTWVDERCVPFAHGDSNRGGAYKEHWLDDANQVGVELPLFLDSETPNAAVARVQRALHESFDDALDVVVLGLGEDAHIASLFPSHTTLDEKNAAVLAVTDSPKPPKERITLTLPLLDTAPFKLVLAIGEGKRRAIESTMAGDPTLPLTRLHRVQLLTDLSFGERS